MPVGFEEDEAKAWLNYDALASKVNEYASPPVSFDLEAVSYQGRRVHRNSFTNSTTSRSFAGGTRDNKARADHPFGGARVT